jgi:putative aminopeptidase FrvX
MKASHRQFLVDLLSLPTAPFNERHVIDYIRRWAAARPSLALTADEYGNLRLDLRTGRSRTGRPLYLSAHMDHPGFAAVRMQRGHELEAKWHGGVQPDFFNGARVRFHDGRRWVRGRVESFEVAEVMGRRRVSTAVIEVRRPLPAGAVGMWDLPDPVIRGSRIYARGCDDVAGVAAVLAALDELIILGKPVCAGALLTRAEEVGFAGAIAACRSGLLPRQARVLSVECSPVQPGMEMGAGPVVRVGDRMSVFTPRMVAWCRQVADRLSLLHKGFAFQRKLLDGGACESTAYMEYGHETTGLSLPLGNYHNMNHRTGRIAAEYVDLNDFERLVWWFIALVNAEPTPRPGPSVLLRAFTREHRTWGPMLRRSVRQAGLSGSVGDDSLLA